jgi:NDP-sugar pyrophosphorylase family protein
MKAIILAGGFGTRLHPITQDKIPKCMVEVMEKPLVYYIVRNMKKQGITDITLALHHKADQFMKFCQQESVKYKIEEIPLGTGGAIKNCIEGDDPVLVVNGDTVSTCNYIDMTFKRTMPLSIAVDESGVSAGIYIMRPHILDEYDGAFSFEKDVIPNIPHEFYHIPWFTDAGTPDGYEKVKSDVED